MSTALWRRCVPKKELTLIYKIYRKQFYSVSYQVCCDTQRRVKYLSVMCPGATPDIFTHLAGSMYGVIRDGKLNPKWHFVGDSEVPNNYEHPSMLTPFTRFDLCDTTTRVQRDNYNYYLSQLCVNQHWMLFRHVGEQVSCFNSSSGDDFVAEGTFDFPCVLCTTQLHHRRSHHK